MNREVSELIHGAKTGVGEAFVELVVRYEELVRTTIRRLVPIAEVDDIAQEVFTDFAQRIRDDEKPTLEFPERWLKAVSRNKAVSHLRSTKRARFISMPSLSWVSEVDSEPFARGHDPNEEDVNYPRLKALRYCISLLQPRHREVLDAFYLKGQSTELIAVQTGRGHGAVRMMLVRIRRSLAQCIKKRMNSI
ncbi:MAG TPA: sigma-70 family RNA polymerase sigma factor [Pirellulaceae bacterium]|nr:sigma-70 family RNA polymerase sigma factor [Pirellulaceae bacterium]HMO92767.1 sigma-70 family RNA polymerase sigma factor [Pirellulaceae bacterium]HMP69349.1 sigma-70 family RNA polymerase sigma factor [Pirellulaceae bacterium]